ncbi:MAG: LacI family DNA-binding transcriptional regulator [Planctomycetota bacterium]
MPSVRQIAKEAGVSTATVSRVINNSPKVSDLARQKVLDVINEHAYTPSTGKLSANNVAYIFTDSTTLGSPFDAGVLAGLSGGLENNHLDLLVLNARTCRQPGETFNDVFRRKGVCGAIVRTTFSSQALCRAILDSRQPVVVIGDQIEGHEASCIDVDSRSASREAVEHLIELGHQRIGFCTNVVDDKDHEDRYGGYGDAIDQAGMEIDPKLFFRVPANRQGGEQFARRLASLGDRPTALFVADPATCIGLLTETRKLGIRVPDELSVVGFDDAEVRYSTAPQLSAVCQDAQRLGEEALRRLAALMPGRPPALETQGVPLRAWFEVNASTGPA